MDELSLWLEPTGEDLERISKIFNNIQREYNSPIFIPHVTLIDNIPQESQEIESKVTNLKCQKFKIKFKAINIGKKIYNSIFLECEQSLELMKLNKSAQEVYSKKYTYNPHMSVIYGNFSYEGKQKIIQDLTKVGLDNFNFEAKTISLWHAEGETSNWKKIFEKNLN